METKAFSFWLFFFHFIQYMGAKRFFIGRSTGMTYLSTHWVLGRLLRWLTGVSGFGTDQNK